MHYHPTSYKRVEKTPQNAKRAVSLFMAYRLILAISMWFTFSFSFNPSPLGNVFPKLFTITLVIYFILGLISSLILALSSIMIEKQIQFALLVDIISITLLMHASGGITSGLGLLIAISITLGSLLTGGNLAVSFAAIASIAVLSERFYTESFGLFPADASSYTQAGLLGSTFFAVAMLAYGLARQLQEMERLAQQRGVDLANLAQVNEYIIQHMITGILVVDQNWNIRLLNDTAWYLLGSPNMKSGNNLNNFPSLARLTALWIQSPQQASGTFQLSPGSKEIKPQFIQLGPNQKHSGILIFLEDIAKILEQAQQIKLASLGRLTASIAHEIRNPLGAISHAAQLLAESTNLNSDDRRLTEIIKNNSLRVNGVIETVLQLSRRNRANPVYIELNKWINQFITEFCNSRMLDTNYFAVQINHAVLIQADIRQLTQVLENLCENSLKYGGEIKNLPFIQLNGGITPNTPWPVLEVQDHGVGIAPEHVRQIFEPFFTTAAKSGTGLGLYIAKELCEINQIDLEYIPVANGSCFRLSFHNWQIN
jgi:two-component system sensor histidine kinase PilS (NtrC family)